MSADASSETRSGPRIPAKIPVLMEGTDVGNQPVREESDTLLVNEAGALLALNSEFRLQDRLRVTNRVSGLSTECRIAWRSSSKINKRWSYGIALLTEENDFWGLKKH